MSTWWNHGTAVAHICLARPATHLGDQEVYAERGVLVFEILLHSLDLTGKETEAEVEIKRQKNVQKEVEVGGRTCCRRIFGV